MAIGAFGVDAVSALRVPALPSDADAAVLLAPVLAGLALAFCC